MRFHVPTQPDDVDARNDGRRHVGARSLRPTTAGVISLLFLVALTILLLRRGRDAEREPVTEPARRPDHTPSEDRRLGHYYTVRPDDTLESLARRFYRNSSRWPDIARANDIRNPRRLEIGRQLWIPVPAR